MNIHLRTPDLTPIRMPEPPLSQINPAHWTYNVLIEQIRDFEAGLDDEHEVGGRLVSFGNTTTFHIEEIGYHGPFMVMFYGRDVDGQQVTLVQHFTQLNVLLIAMKKQQEKPRRIGFQLPSAEE